MSKNYTSMKTAQTRTRRAIDRSDKKYALMLLESKKNGMSAKYYRFRAQWFDAVAKNSAANRHRAFRVFV